MYVVNISSFIYNILLFSIALTNFLSLAYRPSSDFWVCNLVHRDFLTYLIEILLDLLKFQQKNLDRNLP